MHCVSSGSVLSISYVREAGGSVTCVFIVRTLWGKSVNGCPTYVGNSLGYDHRKAFFDECEQRISPLVNVLRLRETAPKTVL